MAEHHTNIRESNREKHEKGEATRRQDQYGGEKGDVKRVQCRTYVQPKDHKK